MTGPTATVETPPTAPRVLKLDVLLGSFTYAPPRLDEAGAVKAESSITFQVIHEDQAPDELFSFLDRTRGEIQVGLEAQTDGDDLADKGWQGIGKLGTFKVDLPGTKARETERGQGNHPVIRFPVTIEAAKVAGLDGFWALRGALSDARTNEIELTLQAVQEDLPFLDDDSGDDE